MGYWWTIKKKSLFYFEKPIPFQISHTSIWKVYRIFIFHPSLMWFILLNGLCWELSVVCRWTSSIFYRFWVKLDQKRLKSGIIQNLKVFISHPILRQFISMGYWWSIKKIYYFNLKNDLKWVQILKFRIFKKV